MLLVDSPAAENVLTMFQAMTSMGVAYLDVIVLTLCSKNVLFGNEMLQECYNLQYHTFKFSRLEMPESGNIKIGHVLSRLRVAEYI